MESEISGPAHKSLIDDDCLLFKLLLAGHCIVPLHQRFLRAPEKKRAGTEACGVQKMVGVFGSCYRTTAKCTALLFAKHLLRINFLTSHAVYDDESGQKSSNMLTSRI